jgi:hypothetical protein
MKFEHLLSMKAKEFPQSEQKALRLSTQGNEKYYQFNLRLCRLSKFGAFPRDGMCPFEDRKAGNWMCVQVDVSVNHIKKLSRLEPLIQLRVLDLSVNHIIKIEGLEMLAKLEELNMSSNGLHKIEGLNSCTALRVLNLASNRIRLLENLEPLTNLGTLIMTNNKIEVPLCHL